MEGRHIFSQALSAVPLRVDRDEQGLHPVCLGAQIIHHLQAFNLETMAAYFGKFSRTEDYARESRMTIHGFALPTMP